MSKNFVQELANLSIITKKSDSYPKEPIMPGASAEISVKYDTQRVGQFTKYVTLTTNALNNTSSRLTISGEVMSTETTPTLSPATPSSTAPKM